MNTIARQQRIGFSRVRNGDGERYLRHWKRIPARSAAASTTLVAIAVLQVSVLAACEITVRDAAFLAPRDVHRLCVMGNSGDAAAQSIADSLAGWLEGPGRGMNLELVEVDADDSNVQWSEFAIPSAPPNLPVVALIGRSLGAGGRFVIDHWEPGPSPEDLAVLLESPVRKRLQSELGRSLAVLLFAPGTGPGGGSAQAVLDEVVRSWSERAPLGISIVRLDRTDHRERTVVSFLGLEADGPDWVGVVFGRGKLMGPPLEGTEITVENLSELIDKLDEDCSCEEPLPAMGVDIPLGWNDSLDASVVALADFAEEEDEVKSAPPVAAVALGDAPSESETPKIASGRAVTRDMEGSIPVLRATTLWISVAAVLVVLVASAGMFWRVRQRDFRG